MEVEHSKAHWKSIWWPETESDESEEEEEEERAEQISEGKIDLEEGEKIRNWEVEFWF